MMWLDDLKARLCTRIWVASYALEQSQAVHLAQGHFMRSACCCFGLALLRIIGGHT